MSIDLTASKQIGRYGPVLSICIPTCNRAEVTEETVKRILSLPDFGTQTEIVVSDNCSTDDTEDRMRRIAAGHDSFVYSRNTKNIGDRNFYEVMRCAKGQYLKLSNDTLRYKPGGLEKIRNIVERYNPALLLFLRKNSGNVSICRSLDDLINRASYAITWIGGLCIRRDALSIAEAAVTKSESHLFQVELVIDIVNSGQRVLVVKEDIFEVKEQTRKGGYDLFGVFVHNYLVLLSKQVNQGKLSREVLQREKLRLLFNFVIPWLTKLYLWKRKRYFFKIRLSAVTDWYSPIALVFLFPTGIVVSSVRALSRRLAVSLRTA